MENLVLHCEEATLALGRMMALHVRPPFVLYLEGDLGAGKTTLMRGMIVAMGHAGAVKSPTYGLAETYETAAGHCVHLDLYRIADPDELEYLGVLDDLGTATILAVEWPENGRGGLPPADMIVRMSHALEGRSATFEPLSPRGEAACKVLLNSDIQNISEV